MTEGLSEWGRKERRRQERKGESKGKKEAGADRTGNIWGCTVRGTFSSFCNRHKIKWSSL